MRNGIKTGIFAFMAMVACCISPSVVMAEIGPFHLRIGFSSAAFVSVPKDDMRIAVEVLTQKVARKTIGSAESRVYDSTAEIEKDLQTKKLDVVALGLEEFMQLRTHAHLEPAMITMSGKSCDIELLLLTRKDSGLNRFTDLNKRTIALPSKKSQYGATYLTWIETLVMKEGAGSLGGFFSSFQETRNASQAIMSVFFRKADSCVVTSQAFEVTCELNPQIARELKTISHSDRLAGGIIAFRQDLAPERKQKVRQALMTLHEDQEGRQMFVLFQLSKLTPYRPEYMRGTEALYAEHRKLKARLVKK
jgi:ABC-type phosphate/phosphonate transport system substrate-binding protein